MNEDWIIPKVTFRTREGDEETEDGGCAIGGHWVTKTTDDYREEEYARDKRIIGDDEILDRRTRLFSTSKGFEFDETLDYTKKENVLTGPVKDAETVIQEMLNLGPLSHEFRGSAGSNLANREQIIKDLTQWITNSDADTRNEIKQFLEQKKFNMPGQG